MKFSNSRYGIIILFTILSSIFLTGCASAPFVLPTREELNAARPYKKTVAVLGFSENGSSVKGIRLVAASDVEGLFSGQFNVVERGRIQRIVTERDFNTEAQTAKTKELGKMLGADYAVLGNVVVSVPEPELKHTEDKFEDKFSGKVYKFKGQIWEETSVQAEVFLKIVDVNSSMIIYSGSQRGYSMKHTYYEDFDDESSYRRALRNRQSFKGQLLRLFKDYASLNREYSSLVSTAIGKAVDKFKGVLRSQFVIAGEILQIISENEVIVNLGSAYGIKPGDSLVIWKEQRTIRDPKTGTLVAQKKVKAVLKVSGVTSGLTCTAKAGKNIISQLRVGEKVFTR
ncbi:MAG: CsgG/HfaB family protein [Candidatus Omnitrophota bacterium]